MTSRRRRGSIARAIVAAAISLVLVPFVAPGPAFADRVRNEQWQLTALGAKTAWQYATGANVVVAVLDSGVDATHPDLAGQVLPGADFVDGSTDGRTDPVGHGTTVAALIAGRTDDGTGVAGLAPKAKILPVRVLDAQNRYHDAAQVARGLRWAVDHGAQVVNLSLGGAGRSTELTDAVGYAQQRDVVVVACTGNVTTGDAGQATTGGASQLATGGTGQMWYPAREPGVVAVTGLTPGPAGATGRLRSGPGRSPGRKPP